MEGYAKNNQFTSIFFIETRKKNSHINNRGNNMKFRFSLVSLTETFADFLKMIKTIPRKNGDNIKICPTIYSTIF